MAVSIRALAGALADVVGGERLSTDAATLERYRADGVTPAWVVWPASVDEVSRLLRLASGERLAVIPRGSGALISLGNPPRRLDGILDLSRLATLVAHEPRDLTATVQCGVSLAAVAAPLAAHHQFLPLDPLGGMSRSVGGVLATNGSGPLRFRYGTPRDLLLGIRFVQADGTVTWGGAKVVKSVTGYDVPKLMVGSLGTLGVLVEATLRLHPLPEAEATWLVRFASVESAAGLLGAVLDSALQPNRLEITSSDGHATVAVSFGSVPEAVAAEGDALRALARREGGQAIAAPPEFWSRLGTLLADATVSLKIAALPAETAGLCGEVQQLAGGLGLATTIVGEAGNGILHVAWKGTLTAAEWDHRLIAPLRERVAPSGGSVVVEHAPRALKERIDVWGPAEPATLAIMRRLKDEFDPLGILNPGRFLNRI